MFVYLYRKFPEEFQPYFWRIVSIGIGLIVLVLWLLFGFWKTLLTVIILTISYVIGSAFDGKLDTSSKNKGRKRKAR
jgi:uncharacterized membrane protein